VVSDLNVVSASDVALKEDPASASGERVDQGKGTGTRVRAFSQVVGAF